MTRPARTAEPSGANAESPRAITSALTNSSTDSVPFSRASAVVDLPAPFGPLTTTMLGECSILVSMLHGLGRPSKVAGNPGSGSYLDPMFPHFRLGVLLLLPLLVGVGPAERRTLDTPAGKLSYETAGEGDALVLIHDGLLPSAGWDEVWGFFTARWRTLRYDRRGYGDSEPARASYTDVVDLAALLDAAGIGRATLVGSSAGGGLAVDFALAHPERVEALVLIGAVVSGGSYSEHFRARGLTNGRPYRTSGDIAGTIERWVADPYFVAPESRAAQESMRRLLTAHPEPALGTLRWSDDPPTAPARLREIQSPALILVGEHDIPDVHAHAGMLEAGLVRAKRIVVAGAGHEVALEQPQAFEEAVLEFLRPREVAESAWTELAPKSASARAAAAELLAYDASRPLDAREKATETRGAARLVDLDYASPHHGRVPAWLALPETPGKHPGILFLHYGQGNRGTFLDEMVMLAGKGVVSLSIDGTENRPDYRFAETPFYDVAAAREDKSQLLTDLRRGLDLLAARPRSIPRASATSGTAWARRSAASSSGSSRASRPPRSSPASAPRAASPSAARAATPSPCASSRVPTSARLSWTASRRSTPCTT
jgi:3-oxoadipate enol-lactonase